MDNFIIRSRNEVHYNDRSVLIFRIILFTFLQGIPCAAAFSGSGAGTLEDPFVITNCTQLQEMANDLTENFTVGNDIDCYDTLNWNSFAGFIPVGPFSGSFDGRGYNISGLHIYRPSSGFAINNRAGRWCGIKYRQHVGERYKEY